MQIPLTWLKRYVPLSVTPRELAHRLTMAGTEIGGVEEVGADWDRDKVLVGQVKKIEPHPNADRLTLPTLDLGNGEIVTVVCGAGNLSVGQKIAFAREGARLFSSRSGKLEVLKPAKIRGVVSEGMVCSEEELGLGDDHSGIIVLDEDASLGMPLIEYMGDVVLDAEITPNRPDCLSILGIAHEVAAVTGVEVTEPDIEYPEEGNPIANQVKIEITDPDLCSRYAASLITGVKIGPSPQWIKESLARAGQRSINNVVDITNYVMLEYGQPLHAFDFDLVKGDTITVRSACDQENIDTLDDETLDLRPGMLTISDSEGPIALAGIIGGARTAIRDSTISLLIESANFDSVNTRKTATELRQFTEASYRFERSITPDLVTRALRRATRLIVQEAGGTVAEGIVDLWPRKKNQEPVGITKSGIKKVLGVDFGMDLVEQTLVSLGFEVISRSTGSSLLVKVPYWRTDIVIEEDLVEEIARICGYDRVPTEMLSTPVPHRQSQPFRDLRERIRDLLVGMGMQEVISYSLTNLETLAAARVSTDNVEPLELANPMSNRLRYLRTSLRASVLETMVSNLRFGEVEGLRLFEIGRVYLPKNHSEDSMPSEPEMLVGVMSGLRSPVSWLAADGRMGFFDTKGVLEALFKQLGLKVTYERTDDAIMRSGRSALVSCGDTKVGVVGEVLPSILERFGFDENRVGMFEIDLGALLESMHETTAGYQETNRFPESEHDVAIIVDDSVASSEMQSVIEANILVKYSTPIDVYVGGTVPVGKKSITYRVVFQSPEGTLTADQVNSAREDILGRLRNELGAELRG